jgi:hypothetical protein
MAVNLAPFLNFEFEVKLSLEVLNFEDVTTNRRNEDSNSVKYLRI